METKSFIENERTSSDTNNTDVQKMAEQFQHINGWGIDADPMNEPTYPMKNYNGDDHKRSGYTRPTLQEADVEMLHSNERTGLSAVFGNVNPPTGLSGAIRRYAFRYSEESLRHWFALVLADRVNVIEGIFTDLLTGRIPNIIAEKGLQAEWKYNRKSVLRKAVITAVAMTVVLLFWQKKKSYISNYKDCKNTCPDMQAALKRKYTVTRPLEFVAFFTLKVETQEAPVFIFLALDAYSGFLYNLGKENDEYPVTVLKKIYYLLEDPDFMENNTCGFTLVMEKYRELENPIARIVALSNGQVLFDTSFNELLYEVLVKSLVPYVKKAD